MNIGIVTTWFERGAAYVSKQYKESLEKEGHQVFVFARGGEKYAKGDPNWDSDRVTWSSRYVFPVATYVDLNEFRKWLQKFKIEAVLFNEQVWLKPVQLCRQLGIKTVLYVDYYTEDQIEAFSLFDVLICNTKKHYSAFSWHPQCVYIPWGTDVDVFNTSKIRSPSEKLRFFHSAGMSPHRKGTDLLVRAYEICARDRNFRENTELVIHSQISLRQAIRSKRSSDTVINSLNKIEASGNLVLHEGTVGAPGLYHLGDIYVYPSRLEGVGLTVAEALACGMPVVVPDDGPMNEFIPQNGSHLVKVERFFARADGYYWPQNEVSIDNLSAKLFECYEHRAQIKEYSQLSREHAESNLNWKKNSTDIANAFTETRTTFPGDDVVEFSLRMHSKKYPKIENYEYFYRSIYFLYSKISKITQRFRA